jgi:hypothetical protein
MVNPVGFEPTTFNLRGCCSNQTELRVRDVWCRNPESNWFCHTTKVVRTQVLPFGIIVVPIVGVEPTLLNFQTSTDILFMDI